MSKSLRSMLTPSKTERILLESHKKGGRVGDKQKCYRDEGGKVEKAVMKKSSGGMMKKAGGGGMTSMGPNVPAGTFAEKYKKGGSAKVKKRGLGGLLSKAGNAIESIW